MVPMTVVVFLSVFFLILGLIFGAGGREVIAMVLGNYAHPEFRVLSSDELRSYKKRVEQDIRFCIEGRYRTLLKDNLRDLNKINREISRREKSSRSRIEKYPVLEESKAERHEKDFAQFDSVYETVLKSIK